MPGPHNGEVRLIPNGEQRRKRDRWRDLAAWIDGLG